MDLDPETAQLLERFGFDATLFEELRRRYRAGELSAAHNRIVGQVEPPAAEDVRRLPPLGPPPATSARPGVSLLKRLVRRATGWQVDPLVAQVNALREVTIQALERNAQLEREAAAGRDRPPG